MKTREELGEDRYKVLREGATEAPFSGALLENTKPGVYSCGFCGEDLFKSDNKYESHCGWPSFDDEIPGKVKKLEDTSHGMVRTEIQCAKCESHLGHIFDDGPKETTGLRYCVNSLSLDFKEQDNG